MSEKKKYIAKESFRYGGQSYLPGASIELTAEEATELADFLEGEAPAGKTGSKDQAAITTALKKENAGLKSANDKIKAELTATKEKLTALGNELGELKKAAKGGNQ